MTTIDIIAFNPAQASQVQQLILGIQRDEFGIDIDLARQPDLSDIPGFYQVGRGNFWVAMAGEKVVGTVSLLDIGHGQGALRKMFVDKDYRGSAAGVAQLLLEALMAHARSQGIYEIILGTTAKFLAAHRFYEKNGFAEISKEALPATFPVMAVDVKFYHLYLPASPIM